MAGLGTFNENYPIYGYTSFLPADGTTVKVVVPAAPRAQRIDAILCTNTDAAAHVFKFWIYDGANQNSFALVNVPANAGNGTVPAVAALATYLPSTLSGIVLPPNAELRCSMVVVMAAATKADVTAFGGAV